MEPVVNSNANAASTSKKHSFTRNYNDTLQKLTYEEKGNKELIQKLYLGHPTSVHNIVKNFDTRGMI